MMKDLESTNHCPTNDRLSDLLVGTVPASELETLETHLHQCTTCQTRLDSLSNAPRLASWMGEHRRVKPKRQLFEPSDHPDDLGRLGRFRIIQEIGRGGMGIVYQGIDTELKRSVALKLLRVERDDVVSYQRFLRESQAAGQLRHDHIVPVHSAERHGDDRLVIVMPLITGPSLRQRLRAAEPLTFQQMAEYVKQVADGLAAAHALGIIHRDVKPANILLDDQDHRVKLTDFGLARSSSTGETLTQEGMLVGTPEYLSPELARNPSVRDVRSDLYSLGITLYECLTGVVPFRGTPLEVINSHAAFDPILPRQLNRSVPLELQTICLKCLEKDPGKRYPSAMALSDDLRHWLAGEPIEARPIGRVERAWRWCRRHPLPVSFAAVTLIGLITSISGWWTAGQRRHEAEQLRMEALQKAKLAEERSALALDAINTLISKAQKLSDNTPGTLQLKKQLNEAALNDLRKLTKATALVPGAARATVQAHLKLGNTFHLLGQTEEALSEWELARQQAQEVLALDGDDVATLSDLGRVHYNIGFTWNRKSDYVRAAQHMEEGVKLLEAALHRHEGHPLLRKTLGACYSGRADVKWLTNQASPALADYERAVRMKESLLKEEPDNSEIASNLLLDFSRMGYVNLSVLHEYPVAEQLFARQLEVARHQLVLHPEDRTWQRNYHIMLLDLSSAQQRQGHFTKAEKSTRSALPWLHKTAMEDVSNVFVQRDLAMGHIHLGTVQLARGEYREAETSFGQAYHVMISVTKQAQQSAILANDLPTVCLELSIVTMRQERYEEAAQWLGKMVEHFQTSQAAQLSNPAVQSQLVTLKLMRDGLASLPKAMRDPAWAYRQSEQLIPVVASFRITMLTVRGEFKLAVEEAKQLQERFPKLSYGYSALAMAESMASTHATSACEKEQLLQSACEHYLSSLRIDREQLSLGYLMPELAAVRQNPLFLTRLRQLLHDSQVSRRQVQ